MDPYRVFNLPYRVFNLPYDIFPFDIWSIIFTDINILNDIRNLLLTCKIFYNIVPKTIKVIKDEQKAEFQHIENFSALNTCHLTITNISQDQMKKIVHLKKLSVITDSDNIKNVWMPYWINQTQERFDTISHSLTFKLPGFDSDYNLIINNRFIECICSDDEGIIYKSFDVVICDFIKPLVNNFNLIFIIKYDHYINDILIFRPFGIKCKRFHSDNNPFMLFISHPHISYLEIEKISGYEIFPWKVFPNTMIEYYLNSVALCEREITIKMPLLEESILNIRKKFPQSKITNTYNTK